MQRRSVLNLPFVDLTIGHGLQRTLIDTMTTATKEGKSTPIFGRFPIITIDGYMCCQVTRQLYSFSVLTTFENLNSA